MDITLSASALSPEKAAEKTSITQEGARSNVVPGSRQVVLAYPLKVNGKWLRSITVRPLDQGDVDDWENGQLPTLRDMMLRLTGLNPAVAKALVWLDSEAVLLMVQNTLPEFMTGKVAP